MKKYQIDWAQFTAAMLTIICLVGAFVTAFTFPNQPWPVSLLLLCVATAFSVLTNALLEADRSE